VDWVRPEPRVIERHIDTQREYVDRYSVFDTRGRTRWVTQRTLQAVGTGWLFGKYLGPGWGYDPAGLLAQGWALRSARIGFGAL
jgi:hypothetical protein